MRGGQPPELRATDERGWFRFQRLYDTARSAVRGGADVRRLVLEAAEDDRAEGSGWLEIQVDPTSYAPWLGGLTPAVEVVLDAAREAQAATGVGIGVVIAANRTRHPLDARTLARLAARYAGAGVVGFGLSNDERRGVTEDFAPAFRIAARAGLLAAPHGGELAGPGSMRACLASLGARRIGHGVTSAEEPALLERLARDEVTLEVCPMSNVRLGVFDARGYRRLRKHQAVQQDSAHQDDHSRQHPPRSGAVQDRTQGHYARNETERTPEPYPSVRARA